LQKGENLAVSKRRSHQLDSNTIATYDLSYETDKTTLKHKLLNQGYKLYIINGKRILKKDDDIIEIKEDNDGY